MRAGGVAGAKYSMSMYCENILTKMEILEKEAMKQPVAGYLIRGTKRNIKRDLKNRN